MLLQHLGSLRLTSRRYVGVWMGIRQMGPLVGGAISLALNIKTSEKGKVTYTTYLGLVAISSLGAPLALLLSQPQQVVRSDGTQIPYMKKTNFGIEARAIWKQLRNKYMLLLIPVFLAGQFGVTYQGNYLTSEYLCCRIEYPRVSLTHGIQLTSPFAPEHSPPSSQRLSAPWPTSSPASC
jgi:hypothetical protein